MIFRELSNAAFRFSLRRPGAEIMGGAFKRPLSPEGGGKSRDPAGRGLTRALEEGLRITPSGGGAAPPPIDLSSYES